MSPPYAPCVLALAAVFHCHQAARNNPQPPEPAASAEPARLSEPIADEPIADAAPADFREPAPAVIASKQTDRLSCSFHWRKSDAHGFRPRDEKLVHLSTAGDSRKMELGDAKIAVALESSTAGGGRLTVAFDLGVWEIDDEYDFGAASFPANLPLIGHGFTGLHYLTHPKSGSELQYWCESGNPPTAGPQSKPGTPIMCETLVVDGDAGNEFHVLKGRSLAAPMGSMRLDVRHMPGGADSGGVILDVGRNSRSRGGVHVLYQLRADELPANLFPDTAGFTGRTTINDTKTGVSAGYSCWAAK